MPFYSTLAAKHADLQHRLGQHRAEHRRELHAGPERRAGAAARLRRAVGELVLGRLGARLRAPRHERLHRPARQQPGAEPRRQPHARPTATSAPCRSTCATATSADRRSARESNNAPGCMLDAPTYPFCNTNNTGTIVMFDPELQIPYSDSYTAAWQRQLDAGTSRFEARYLGTRSRDQWETLNYNEANIIENGFVDEFRQAQQNLQVEHRQRLRHDGPARVLVCLPRPGHGHEPAADLPRVLQRRAASRRRVTRRATLGAAGRARTSSTRSARTRRTCSRRRDEREHRPRGQRDAAAERDRRGSAGELLPRQPEHAGRRAGGARTAASRGTTRSS